MTDHPNPAQPAINVDELKALYEKATPGEWRADNIDDISGPFFRYVGNDRVGVPGWSVAGPLSVGNGECGALTEADARFIAAAHNAFPALLNLIAEERRKREELQEKYDRLCALAGSVCQDVRSLSILAATTVEDGGEFDELFSIASDHAPSLAELPAIGVTHADDSNSALLAAAHACAPRPAAEARSDSSSETAEQEGTK